MRRPRSASTVLASLCLALAASALPAHAADGDRDRDGVPDSVDNCAVANPDQADRDRDGIGDYCEDADRDTLSDGYEINVSETNPDRADTDGDGLSDGEEVRRTGTEPTMADTDGDTLSDGDEVRRTKTNPRDQDTDDDAYADAVDNCPTKPNTSQMDLDMNGEGDSCQFGYDEPTLPLPDVELPPLPPLPPLPQPADDAAVLAADLKQLARDGVAMAARQTSGRSFTVAYHDAATGAKLELGLPSDGVYRGDPVQVVLYGRDGLPSLDGPALARWRYYPSTRTVSFTLQGALPASVSGLRVQVPLAQKVCLDAETCTQAGAGFVNGLHRSFGVRDAFDAVLEDVSFS